MQRIQPGQEVLSLFGIAFQPKALKKITSPSLAPTLISAFFIILIVSLLLSLAVKILGPASQSVAAVSFEEEKVAFQPGQFVSQQISQGYLGNYR